MTSPSPVDAIKDAVCSVTKDWARQRKAEERDRNAALNRRARLVRSHRVTLREAAIEVMRHAYLKAADDGSLPTKPRQIMYCARPYILERTGEDTLSGQYFSQTLLVDYMQEYDCEDWDIIWDARGRFLEPHTSSDVPLGTLEVRQYLGLRPSFRSALAIEPDLPFPTSGAQNRFRNVLFIEKEGFHPILQAARLQERFDVALMSTKGMSVTASRKLLDDLSPYIDHIFILHDFDRSGFSIAGTLSKNSRRYVFRNSIREKFVDIGLRLAIVEALELQSEPVPQDEFRTWLKRARTLRARGASEEEIAFLKTRRVELNAMTSRQLVDFVEAKFRAYGVKKVVPDNEVLERQARRIIEQRLAAEEVAKAAKKIAKRAKDAALPDNASKSF